MDKQTEVKVIDLTDDQVQLLHIEIQIVGYLASKYTAKAIRESRYSEDELLEIILHKSDNVLRMLNRFLSNNTE